MTGDATTGGRAAGGPVVVTPPGWAWAADADYAQAVRHRDRVPTRGVGPFDDHGRIVDPGDVEARIRQVVSNLDVLLRRAGSARSAILRQHVHLRRPEDLAVFRRLRRALYAPPYPASVLVAVVAHAHPDMLVETACEAAVTDGHDSQERR